MSFDGAVGGFVARWRKGDQAVRYLIGRGRLESFESADLAGLADAHVARAALRVEATAAAALEMGDVDGAYVAAYDAYRMAAESLLARQGLRATGSGGSHLTVEEAVSAQFAADIPAFAKRAFERLRRTGMRRSISTPRHRQSPRRMPRGRSPRRRRHYLA